ncbi:hypothetical protein FGG08_003173 [Glutinoglossum americanum]|uniref:FAD dependent oxidoreductase domain-containing protein n=1 Tax=Glutinoglossum americanum TaxID=1670608 RepID=A0A9P8KYE6_9PEZI|nr:hypothetical protein FGG08_003173 [Glutinoglossum americanum]
MLLKRQRQPQASKQASKPTHLQPTTPNLLDQPSIYDITTSNTHERSTFNLGLLPMADEQDIVIVGGGIIGCTTAYYLTRHPSYDPAKHRIILFEATKIAGGASGKAGGLLARWAYPSSIVPLSWRLHDELAREHSGVERWGYRRVHAGSLDAQPSAPTSADDGETGRTDGDETIAEQLRASGVPEDLTWLDPSTILSYSSLGSPSNTAQVHPYQFTTSMASLAAEKGVKIILGTVTDIQYTTSPLQSTSPSSNKKGSGTARAVSGVTYTRTDTSTPQTHPATTLILTAGPWTPTLLPSLTIPAHRAHSIVIHPSKPISAHALFTSLPTGLNPEIYPRPDSTIYACGPTDSLIPLPSTTALVEVDHKRCEDIRKQISAISPALRDGEVVTEQACYLPGGGPWIGPVGKEEGLLVAAGHTCWGIMNAPATGKLVAEMVFEGKAKSASVRSLDPRRGMW